jgi:hypothetical protein
VFASTVVAFECARCAFFARVLARASETDDLVLARRFSVTELLTVEALDDLDDWLRFEWAEADPYLFH